MATRSIHVRLEVPEGISEASRADAEAGAHEAAVLSLWQRGELTTRAAARELGMEYRAFLDLVNARGMDVETQLPALDAIASARAKLLKP